MPRLRFWRSANQAHRRTLTKTIIYRVLMVATTILIAFAFTSNVDTALKIGIGANIVKTATYYLYERVWSHITWGME